MNIILPNIENFEDETVKKIFGERATCYNDKIKIKLNKYLHYNDKLIIVNNILKYYSDYFYDNWENNKVCVCLEILGNFLHYEKKKRKQKDKNSTLSNDKIKEMIRGSKVYVNFSDLTDENKYLLGLVDIEEDYT